MTASKAPPRDELLGRVVDDAAVVGSPPKPSVSGRLVWLVIMIAMAAVILLVSAGARRSASVDGSTPTPTTGPPNAASLLRPGGPTDGLESQHLPVRVMPDRDLVDRQQVTVTGSGFRPDVTVGTVMCIGSAQSQGAAACDISTSMLGRTDAEGRVTINYLVRRYPVIQGQTVDCMTGNLDPADWAALLRAGAQGRLDTPDRATCIVAVGEVNDYDSSGGWPIAFAGQTFLPLDPSVSADPPVSVAPVVTDAPVPTPVPAPGPAPAPGTVVVPTTTSSPPASTTTPSSPATSAPRASSPVPAPAPGTG